MSLPLTSKPLTEGALSKMYTGAVVRFRISPWPRTSTMVRTPATVVYRSLMTVMSVKPDSTTPEGQTVCCRA